MNIQRGVFLASLFLPGTCASACDLALPPESLMEWQLNRAWSTCPQGWSSGPQFQMQCITSTLSPAQVLVRLPDAEYARDAAARLAGRAEWVFSVPERGEVLPLNRISLYRLGKGSLLVWRKDLKLAQVTDALMALLELNVRSVPPGKPCVFGSTRLQGVLKQCEVVTLDGASSLDASPVAALKLVFNRSIGIQIQSHKPYVYTQSTICPRWELRPARL